MTVSSNRSIALATAACAVFAGAGVAASVASASGGPKKVDGHRLHARAGAVKPGTVVKSSKVFGDRVFANSSDGYALASVGQAQYPVRTKDSGQVWRIDGPQLHVDAADAPADVGSVGVSGPKTAFAYGSEAIDVTTNGGRTWFQTFIGDLVVAVVPSPSGHGLDAYVQESAGSSSSKIVTVQYVSTDGGRVWHRSAQLGG